MGGRHLSESAREKPSAVLRQPTTCRSFLMGTAQQINKIRHNCCNRGGKIDVRTSLAVFSASYQSSSSSKRQAPATGGYSFGVTGVPSSPFGSFGSGGGTFSAPPAGPAPAGGGFGFGSAPPLPSAPPPPPEAKPAVAQVEGGSGSMGPVTFVVEKPANIK